MDMNQYERIGVGLAISATTLVGGSVAAASLLTKYPVLGGQSIRYAVGAFALLVFQRLRGRSLARPNLREFGWLTGLAATGLAAFSVLLIYATEASDPAAVGVVVGCAPIVLAVVGPLLERRRPATRTLMAAVVVALGAAVAQGDPGHVTVVGLILALGALLCEVLFSILAVPVLSRLGPVSLSAWVAAIASGMLMATALVVDRRRALAVPTTSEAAALLFLALLVTALAFICWYGGIERLGVERAGLFSGLVPVSALVCSAIVGTGTITPSRILGVLVVAWGIVIGLPATREESANKTPSTVSSP